MYEHVPWQISEVNQEHESDNSSYSPLFELKTLLLLSALIAFITLCTCIDVCRKAAKSETREERPVERTPLFKIRRAFKCSKCYSSFGNHNSKHSRHLVKWPMAIKKSYRYSKYLNGHPHPSEHFLSTRVKSEVVNIEAEGEVKWENSLCQQYPDPLEPTKLPKITGILKKHKYVRFREDVKAFDDSAGPSYLKTTKRVYSVPGKSRSQTKVSAEHLHRESPKHLVALKGNGKLFKTVYPRMGISNLPKPAAKIMKDCQTQTSTLPTHKSETEMPKGREILNESSSSSSSLSTTFSNSFSSPISSSDEYFPISHSEV